MDEYKGKLIGQVPGVPTKPHVEPEIHYAPGMLLVKVKEQFTDVFNELLDNLDVEPETIKELDDYVIMMEDTDIGNEEEMFKEDFNNTLKMAKNIIDKYWTIHDNSTLNPYTFYFTPNQIAHLEKLGRDLGFKGRGAKSKGVRYVIDEHIKHYKGV